MSNDAKVGFLIAAAFMALIAYGIHTEAETTIEVAKLTAECKR